MRIRVADEPSPAARRFAREAMATFNLPEPLAILLHRRGIVTLSALEEFLHPRLTMLPSPDRLKGMQEAVAIIVQALIRQETIYIHGDYDVDGLTATALLMSFFHRTGHRAVFHIPNRLEESYGLSRHSIDHLLGCAEQRGRGGVLLTVDCGISSHDEVRYARELGLDVVITDHHEPSRELPPAQAIINPKQTGCTLNFPFLSGVGVAFFLVMALRRAMTEQGLLTTATMPNLKQYLDLVALGTVADVVPLIGVNRILVRAGLEVLSARKRPGVFFLCKQCGMEEARVTAEDISFRLAPRINASGRLGKPEIGLDVLLAQTTEQAENAAAILEGMNAERKRLESEALPEVRAQAEEQVRAGRSVLVIHAESCHPGVMGILASKVSEQFHRPAIVLTNVGGDEALLKGSGRSVAGIHLFERVRQCHAYMQQFGGHAMAVGITVEKRYMQNFAEQLDAALANQAILGAHSEEVRVDHYFAKKEELTGEFARFLQKLQPFGEGNPEPVFLLRGERLYQQKNSKGHLLFTVQPHGFRFRGIGFNLAQTVGSSSGPMDLVFTIKRSRFRGEETDQLHALHLAPS